MSQFYTKTIGSGGYVEFIGVAGAGKTEAANILVSKLMEHNILARRRTPIGYNPLLKIRLFFSLVLLVGKLNYLLFDLIFLVLNVSFQMLIMSKR